MNFLSAILVERWKEIVGEVGASRGDTIDAANNLLLSLRGEGDQIKEELMQIPDFGVRMERLLVMSKDLLQKVFKSIFPDSIAPPEDHYAICQLINTGINLLRNPSINPGFGK